jgi:hypothetical protein
MSIPEELARREERLAKHAEARAKFEARAKKRFEREMAEHRAKLAARDEKTDDYIRDTANAWRGPTPPPATPPSPPPMGQSRTTPRHLVLWTQLKPNKFGTRPTKTMSPAFVMHGDRHDHRTKNRIGFVK